MGLKAVIRRWVGVAEAPATREDAPRATSGEPDGVEVPPDFADLPRAVFELKSEVTLLRMEWAEVLDKITAWANRQAARDRVAFKKALTVEEPREDDREVRIEQEARAAAGLPEPENGVGHPVPHRHPKADLYQRIRRGR